MTATEPKPIATLGDAIVTAEYALQHTPAGCPAVVTPHVLRLLIEAAKAKETSDAQD